MPTDILVATPDQAFGEWLRDSLADHGDYTAHLVNSGSEVLASAASIPYELAILDADIRGEPFALLAHALMARWPTLRLLIIPPDNDPQHPSLAGLTPHAYLERPFYFPDFIELLHSLLAADATRQAEADLSPLVVERVDARRSLSWLEDEDQAAAQLSRLLLEIGAQAALITVEGKVWASAGLLNRAAAQEVAEQLAGCWQGEDQIDMARYARLNTTGGEHLMYATPLLGELALGLLYPARTPLSQARLQAGALARALANLARDQALPVVEAAPAPSHPVDDFAKPAAAGQFVSVELEPDELIPEEEQQIDLSVLLAGMPPPDPNGKPLFPSGEGVNWAPESHPEDEAEALFPWEQAPAQASDPTENATPPSETWMDPRPEEQDDPETTAFLQRLFPGDATQALSNRAAEPTQPISAANGRSITRENAPPVTVPVEPQGDGDTADLIRTLRQDALPVNSRTGLLIGDQVYTCLLLPARPEHSLTGE
ncbi:MAG TPA: hypothetical protein VHO48_01565, partial [Anaerolineaceae bacterium]|nr:hypothetical protein [Anaerolineaceae bacterium]